MTAVPDGPGCPATGAEPDLSASLRARNGLLGLSGPAEMERDVELAAVDDADAVLALDVYVHRLRASIAAIAAAIGGLDVLAFAGGVGQRGPVVRARAAAGLTLLGVGLDEGRNTDAAADAEIGASDAPVRTFAVESREDVQISRETHGLLSRPRTG